ncbi:MAG: carboxypeptidase regulatory-like domain-containing protein [Myxococcales bacterium]|nr:carboxypeptidase regulatory-like domain-containing protein [Myxococcales bacterium]
MKHALALVFMLVATSVSAQTTGTVQVRVVDSAGRPLDGTVTFRAGNATQTCRTVASRCSIALPPGTWSAEVAPTRESSAGPLQVAVRAGVVASVTFRTRPATTPTTTAVVTTATGASTVAPATTTTTATVRTPVVQTAATNGVQRTTRPRTSLRTTPRATATAPVATSTATNGVATNAVSPVATTPRIVTTAPATTTTTVDTGRNLGTGTRVCAQGSVMDSAGRPADATVTVSRDGTTLGTVRSVAGRFSMFDLPPGRYALRAVAARDGRVTQQTLDLGADVARVVVRLR